MVVLFANLNALNCMLAATGSQCKHDKHSCDFLLVKGLVHPKTKIMSLITHPSCHSKPVRPLIIIIHYIYIALSAFSKHSKHQGVSPQPPPVCSIHLDDATAAILRQTHTTHQLTDGEETVMKSNQQIWGLLGGHEDFVRLQNTN